MIAVIADDFTGAAEMGGLALQYNLQVEINTSVNPHTKADVLIIATDTRSQSREDAEAATARISRELASLKPDLIFKKIDSVLRGHVLPEIQVQLQISDLQKALIVPGNPALGRTLTNGTFLLNSEPIHLSSFSNDPEFPVRSSYVADMLQVSPAAIHVITHKDPIPDAGIIVGEIQSEADLEAWTKRIDKTMLVAGAAGLFSAILRTLPGISLRPQPRNKKTIGQPALIVCGSTFHKSRAFVKEQELKGGPVSYMPDSILLSVNDTPDRYKNWGEEILHLLHTYNKAIIAIKPDQTLVSARVIREKMAHIAGIVYKQANIAELMIEGGSTAAAILRNLNLTQFYPEDQIEPGVIRMRTDENKDLHLTVKPGSYPWPPNIL